MLVKNLLHVLDVVSAKYHFRKYILEDIVKAKPKWNGYSHEPETKYFWETWGDYKVNELPKEIGFDSDIFYIQHYGDWSEAEWVVYCRLFTQNEITGVLKSQTPAQDEHANTLSDNKGVSDENKTDTQKYSKKKVTVGDLVPTLVAIINCPHKGKQVQRSKQKYKEKIKAIAEFISSPGSPEIFEKLLNNPGKKSPSELSIALDNLLRKFSDRLTHSHFEKIFSIGKKYNAISTRAITQIINNYKRADRLTLSFIEDILSLANRYEVLDKSISVHIINAYSDKLTSSLLEDIFSLANKYNALSIDAIKHPEIGHQILEGNIDEREGYIREIARALLKEYGIDGIERKRIAKEIAQKLKTKELKNWYGSPLEPESVIKRIERAVMRKIFCTKVKKAVTTIFGWGKHKQFLKIYALATYLSQKRK